MTENAQSKVVYIASGGIEAESIRILLESFGLNAYTNQESAGRTYGLTVGPLGLVEVLVPEDQAEEALKIIHDMDSGKLESSSGEEEGEP